MQDPSEEVNVGAFDGLGVEEVVGEEGDPGREGGGESGGRGDGFGEIFNNEFQGGVFFCESNADKSVGASNVDECCSGLI